ncbi:hypothetical protein UC35_20365 [Ramlibacter tataouinensis]|uniref:Candidate membrane protein n=2 Tax=Ramlibacter tataouinensis TaxID=94132 RepID=A0A140HL78_9BURK|nr:hypothetical protein UC35_20365 [Ramlibacter tataouinensis]
MWLQRLGWVAWPAFLAACMLELIVFAVADPLELQWGGGPLGWSRRSVYTVSFFVFWVVSLGPCALAILLHMRPAEVNECPFDPSQRPEGCPGSLSSRTP